MGTIFETILSKSDDATLRYQLDAFERCGDVYSVHYQQLVLEARKRGILEKGNWSV